MAALKDLVGRIPPHSVEAERAILGSAILSQDELTLLTETLVAEDFYRDIHKRIYGTMFAMLERGLRVDLVTLVDELRTGKILEEIGGVAYIAGLVEEASTLTNLKAYAGIVREKAMLRDLISTSMHTLGYAYEGTRPVKDLLEESERELFKIADRQITAKSRSVRALLGETFEYIEKLYTRKEVVTGLSSGLPDLDAITSGFQRKDMIVVAGRPSSGKTAFALGVARKAAMNQKRVLVFSMEMATQQLMLRLLSAEGRVDSGKLRTGFLSPDDFSRLTNAAGRISESMMAIDDSATLTPMEMRAKSRRFEAEGGIDLIVIDYLQLMRSGARAENRQQEVTQISRAIKALAKEMDCPVLALSQLGRAVEQREKKEPVISDLRESGSLEQDADVVLLLYRPEMYGLTVDGDSQSEIIVGKQRNGPVGRVKTTFVAEYGSFESVYRRAEPRYAPE